MTQGNEENEESPLVRELRKIKAEREEVLRRTTESVERLRREKARLEASVRTKEAMVASRRQ